MPFDIVVHPADAEGRYQIHLGAKRWRAAQRNGLREVPVVVRDGPTNPCAQVAENQKRHGQTLFDLPPVVDAAMKADGCSSTRTLCKLGKLHAEQPERVAELGAGTAPITRDAVAEIRDTVAQAPAAARTDKPRTARPGRAAQLLSRATGLCEKLEATAEPGALPADDRRSLGHAGQLRFALRR